MMNMLAWDPNDSALKRADKDVPLFWATCLQDPHLTAQRCELEAKQLSASGKNSAYCVLYLSLCYVRIERLSSIAPKDL